MVDKSESQLRTHTPQRRVSVSESVLIIMFAGSMIGAMVWSGEFAPLGAAYISLLFNPYSSILGAVVATTVALVFRVVIRDSSFTVRLTTILAATYALASHVGYIQECNASVQVRSLNWPDLAPKLDQTRLLHPRGALNDETENTSERCQRR
jgi:hypothetical protein